MKNINYEILEQLLSNSNKPNIQIDDYIFELFKICMNYFKKNVSIRITDQFTMHLDVCIDNNIRVSLHHKNNFDKNGFKGLKISVYNQKVYLKKDLKQLAKATRIYTKVNFDYSHIVLNNFKHHIVDRVILFFKIVEYLHQKNGNQ